VVIIPTSDTALLCRVDREGLFITAAYGAERIGGTLNLHAGPDSQQLFFGYAIHLTENFSKFTEVSYGQHDLMEKPSGYSDSRT
jgi:hypothetical protein